MFHGDEVNFEAMVFVHWALEQLAHARDEVPPELAWLRDLPIGLNIVCSTRAGGEVITEVAAMRLDYDVGGEQRSSYTCQFHPELTHTLRDYRFSRPPRYGAL